jgi:uncharacterized protein YehS (DUF1456 family)
MNNNDTLIRIRYALDISDTEMIEMFELADYKIDHGALTDLLKKEGEQGFVECSGKVLGFFLDGLILQKRGRKEDAPAQSKMPYLPLTNNAVLKKMRIALELKEDDMLGTLKLAGVDISRAELTALFRKEGHKNYKECGDQFLRKFLRGLAMRCRKQS